MKNMCFCLEVMFSQQSPLGGGGVMEQQQQQQGAGSVPATPADMKEMRSVVLTGFGDLSKVKVYKSPHPMVGPGEVLIRVQACGMNFHDMLVRQGAIANLPNTPLILGYECAGYVEELGPCPATSSISALSCSLQPLNHSELTSGRNQEITKNKIN